EGHGTTSEQQKYSYKDSSLTSGKYSYRLKQIDYDGSFKYSKEMEVDLSTPLKYLLEQNYPNPFNPTTTISYSIKTSGQVQLKVYDMLGTEVASLVNENQEAGNYSVTFNAAELPRRSGSALTSGIYFYTLTSGNFMETKKLILLK
ncbi:MAG: T9SS type A sorting domain-containing protein, partial [Ignavibacteriaceae bacterium]|nr:T9SS type A sorting domain-containing protein [Ignavibacteriaceae bacterium]